MGKKRAAHGSNFCAKRKKIDNERVLMEECEQWHVKKRFPTSVSLLVFTSLSQNQRCINDEEERDGERERCKEVESNVQFIQMKSNEGKEWKFREEKGKDRFSKVYLGELMRIVSWVVRRCGVLARAVGRLIVRWSVTVLIVIRTILITVMVVT